MNTSSKTMGGAFESQAVAPAVKAPTRPYYWSVRRELWEYRSIYFAPLIVAGVFLFGFLITMLTLPHRLRALSPKNTAANTPYDVAAGLILGAAFIVTIFYCLDALYGERRDRSILFWKSLPVSDVTVVLSKASIPFLTLFIGLAITFVTQFIMLLLNSAVFAIIGQSVSTLWNEVSFFHSSLLLLYHVATVHMLTSAPAYAWLLLVSAWSRRTPFLWAVLPPFVIAAMEKLLFNTTHFAALVGGLFMGGTEATPSPHQGPMGAMTHITPGHFLASPGLWVGLIVVAAFLFLAARLRRNNGPI